MLKRFTATWQRRDPVRAPASIPDGIRVYAIGDIHGRADLLDELMQRIAQDRAGHSGRCRIIFLGDYVNRGGSSRQVLERLSAMAQASDEHVFLMGNHEEILLRMIDGTPALVRLFLKMGGRETLLSYGMTAAQYHAATLTEIADFLQAEIPVRHLDFLCSLGTQLLLGDYLFVHAGVDVARGPLEQDSGLTRWIREGFADRDVDYEKVVVHGHTITDQVSQGASRIGIDTGAYASGRLTALVLEQASRRILQTGPLNEANDP